MWFLDLPCPKYTSINAEIEHWIDKQKELARTKIFWNPVDTQAFIASVPLFKEWLMQNNLPVRAVAVTYGRFANCCGPHTDTPPARFKLSWPVKNTKKTYNRWFRSKVHSPHIITNNLGGSVYLLEQLEEIARREVIAPALIDAGQIHDVWCDESAKFPRIVLQCHLYHEPKSLQDLA